ncbi:MAG TPA: phospho-sugar mutase [Tenuifilaceae bacterium]|nr:phospho-sugar mutase [Tenuifilaceae bacterium]
MNADSSDSQVMERAKQWLSPVFDMETREQVQQLISGNHDELVESFYRDLEFGTGGLRGIMGVGTNRMNIYTVGIATQGLANYLKKQLPGIPEVRAAIAFDSRNNSIKFAQIAAKVLSANGVRVYLFDSLRPTPELSFAIRTLKCHCGIVVTASHNPKEYNGYKVYWEDGAQVVPPHDSGIIAEVQAIRNISEVNFNGNESLISTIGPEMDEIYSNTLSSLSLSPKIIKKHKEIVIVYTPIHGTGVKLVPKTLRKFGFTNIVNVPEQDVVDGNFPTVSSPNPEEPSAMRLALEKAKEVNADVVMATDPDADRVGLGVRTPEGKYTLLNGNQAASILIYYVLQKWHEANRIKGREFIVKTIVTTDLLAEIARKYGVECYEVLTGFKYIAEKIRQLEGEKKFIAGGEESYGYLCGDFVRDKDAVISCALFAEATAWAKEQGKSLYEVLAGIYREFGLYSEKQLSITLKGKEGLEEISRMMVGFRKNPPLQIDGLPVITIHDYLSQETKDVPSGSRRPLQLPKSDVLQFLTADGTKVSVRPSGTEPKIKFYIAIRGDFSPNAGINEQLALLDERISRIAAELKITR